MGMFVKVLVVKNATTAQTMEVLQQISLLNNNEMEILLDETYPVQVGQDTLVRLNYTCVGSDELTECFSLKHDHPIMFLQIYDGDFWEYIFYDKGELLDRFCPIPDYFEDLSDEELAQYKGNPQLIADQFGIAAADIEKYFIFWTDEVSIDQKAYPKDEFGCEDWQMSDFMRKIGFSYDLLD